MHGGRITETVNPTRMDVPDYFTRRLPLERALAVILLLPAGPIILLLAVVVRVTSRGPAIYRQQRVGKDGKPFDIYKLRSMVDDAEQLSGPIWCLPGDSRITPVGKLLRLLHLDELPQLVNVVRGEMSLVGPRPERPELAETLVAQIPDYAERLCVLPGITGLAQIELPPDTSPQSVHKKTELDLHYIRSASVRQDMRIVCYTLLKVLGFHPTPQIRDYGPQRQPACPQLTPNENGPLQASKPHSKVATDPMG